MIALYILSGVLSAAVLIYVFVLVFPGIKGKRKVRFNRFFTDYAHRGLWGDGIPENSLSAFDRAAKSGFGIELDVRLSKDGEVFVFHDNDLFRMTGKKGKFWEFTSEEIEQLRLNGTGEKIPRFTEVLKTVDGRVPIMVELKGEDFNTSVCAAADRILGGYTGDYCVESFNPVLVGWYRKNRPEIMRGQLVDPNKKLLPRIIATLVTNIYNRPDFISYRFDRYNRIAVGIATGLWGAKRVVWTVKSEQAREKAIKDGAAVIFEGFVPEKNS